MGASGRAGFAAVLGIAMFGCGHKSVEPTIQKKPTLQNEQDAKDSYALVGAWKNLDPDRDYYPHYIFLENRAGMMIFDPNSLWRFTWKFSEGILVIEFPDKRIMGSDSVPVKVVANGYELKILKKDSILFNGVSALRQMIEYSD